MAVSINRIMTALEGRILLYGLQLCTLFRLIRSINEYSIGQSNVILVIGVLNLAILVIMFTLLNRYKTFCFVVLHFMFLVTSCMTWSSSGGDQGIIPYAIIAMAAFAIFTSHGLLLTITLLAYAFVTIYLTQSAYTPLELTEPALVTQLNFLLCMFLLVRLCIFAKNRFVRYGDYVRSVNKRLDASATVLKEQALQLKEQSEQLMRLRTDLESKIALRHLERDEKQAMLSKFAHVNAHHVRGPVARILGLIALLERESLSGDGQRFVQEVKTDALEIDGVIRKINEVLSE